MRQYCNGKGPQLNRNSLIQNGILITTSEFSTVVVNIILASESTPRLNSEKYFLTSNMTIWGIKINALLHLNTFLDWHAA